MRLGLHVGQVRTRRDRAGANAVCKPLQVLKIRALFAWLALLTGTVSVPPFSDAIAALSVLAAVALGWSQLRSVPRVLLMLAMAGGALAALWAPQALTQAVAGAARLGALVIAVLLLSGTLGASRDVQVLSASVAVGRPLARYLGVAFATGVLAVPLNFGAVAVMSALVARIRQQHGDGALARNTARAVLRGFALASVCSPLSIAVVLTLTLLPGLRLLELISASAPFALLFLLLGAAFREPERRLPAAPAVLHLTGLHGLAAAARIERSHAAPAIPSPANPAPAAQAMRPLWAWLRFGGTIVAVCAGAYVASHAGGIAYARAVALTCIAAAAVSLIAGARHASEPVRLPNLADIGNELAVIAGSAFLGVLAGHAGVGLLGPGFSLSPTAFPWLAFCVPWLLFAGGMAGLNPIVTGTLAGALLGPIWPREALLGLGVGTVCGWGLTVAGTPWSANSLLLNRLTGYDAHTAAWQWNLQLSLLALWLAGLLAAGLTWVRLAI